MTEYNSFQIAMCKVYYLSIYADGDMTEDEYEKGKRILRDEGIIMDSLKIDVLREFQILPRHEQIKDCGKSLQILDRSEQMKCIAWMCRLEQANHLVVTPESPIYDYFLEALKIPDAGISLAQSDVNKKGITDSHCTNGIGEE